ncbi:MAG TPA: flagellar motor protein MotB [Candidatus Aquicultor sp.]|jgi:chemotaxis protein MotB
MERGKPKDEGHGPSMERWLLTYSDLITLLMAFFVIMYAMSNVDAVKYASMADSLKVAMGLQSPGSQVVPNMMSGGKTKDKNSLKNTKNTATPSLSQVRNFRDAKEEQAFAAMLKKIKDYTKKKGVTGLEANEDARGVVINLSDKVLFDIGKADLAPSAQAILSDLAGIVLPTGKQIKVEGHTDNIPIKNDRYPSNWQLSTDRATNVIMYWINRFPSVSDRLSAAGYGEYRPVASNLTAQGRAKNRRVEIIVLRDMLSIAEPTAKTETSKSTTKTTTSSSALGEQLPKK